MRKKTLTRNIILAIVILAMASYVLVSFGKAPPRVQGDTITKVGNTTLTVKDIKIALKNLNKRFGKIDKETLNSIAASSLINDAVMKNAADDLGIIVSDEELRDFIIRYRKGFSKEGKFVDNERWAQWVKFNHQMSVGTFEEYLRTNDLKLTHFRNLFQYAVVVTDDEVKQYYTDANQQVDVDYATINSGAYRGKLDLSDEHIKTLYDAAPEKFMTMDLRQVKYVFLTNDQFKDQVVVSDEDVAAYFNERKDKPPYHMEERVHAKHILIKPKDGKKDQALAKIKKIRAEIEKGLSFDDAAKKYSDDKANANRGGDLGYATRNRWDPKFAEAAFSLELNKVSQPVESSFGYHLITVLDKKPEQTKTLDDVKESITKQLVNRKSRDLTREKATEFQEKLQISLDLDAVAKEYGVEVHESKFFDLSPQSVIDNTIRKNTSVSKQVFALKNKDDFTDTVDIGRGVVIAKWIAEKEPQPLNWDVDTLRIRTEIENQLAEDYAAKLVAQLNKKAAANPEITFKELVSGISFIKDRDIKTLPAISKQNPPASIGAPDLTFEKLFKQDVHTVMGPLHGKYNRQFVIVFISKKLEADFNQFEMQKADITKRLRSEKSMEFLENYIFAEREILDPNNEKLAHVKTMLPD